MRAAAPAEGRGIPAFGWTCTVSRVGGCTVTFTVTETLLVIV